MTEKKEVDKWHEEAAKQLDKIAQMGDRLEMIYKHIDQLDTMVSTLIECIIRQPVVTIQVTCPKCGSNINVSLSDNAMISTRA